MMSCFRKAQRTCGWCVVVAGLLAATSWPASASLITLRSDLAGADFIEWGQLGADGDQVTEPGAVTSNLGVSALVNNPNGDLYRFDEGGLFVGNFAPGDQLLHTFFGPGPISIDFTVGVSAVGAQIQANDFGAFTGVISVYDLANGLLETYDVIGNSNDLGDNSAIFLGVSRLTADILRVEFNISGTATPDFAINRVDLTAGPANPVPEPATATLVLLGGSLVGLVRSRRRTERNSQPAITSVTAPTSRR